MKRALLVIALMLSAGLVHADGRQTEADFNHIEDAYDITVSTAAWTLLTPSNSAQRIGLMVDEYDTNAGNMLVAYSVGSATAPAASISAGFTMKPSDQPWFQSLSSRIQVWARSLNTSAEKVRVMELK